MFICRFWQLCQIQVCHWCLHILVYIFLKFLICAVVKKLEFMVVFGWEKLATKVAFSASVLIALGPSSIVLWYLVFFNHQNSQHKLIAAGIRFCFLSRHYLHKSYPKFDAYHESFYYIIQVIRSYIVCMIMCIEIRTLIHIFIYTLLIDWKLCCFCCYCTLPLNWHEAKHRNLYHLWLVSSS